METNLWERTCKVFSQKALTNQLCFGHQYGITDCFLVVASVPCKKRNWTKECSSKQVNMPIQPQWSTWEKGQKRVPEELASQTHENILRYREVAVHRVSPLPSLPTIQSQALKPKARV